MKKHLPNNGREIKKKGTTVYIAPRHFSEERNSDRELAKMDQAIKMLKRRMVQEGMVKDLKRKEYHETKGQKARKKMAEAVARERKRQREQEW